MFHNGIWFGRNSIVRDLACYLWLILSSEMHEQLNQYPFLSLPVLETTETRTVIHYLLPLYAQHVTSLRHVV